MPDLSAISSNPWIPASAGAAFAAAIAIVIYFLSRKVKEPTYLFTSDNLVAGLASQYSGLAVTFAGQTIESVSVTKLAFWNSGRETIERGDVPPDAQLVVPFPTGVNLLDCRVLYSSSPANKFTSTIRQTGDTRSVVVEFDFLDCGQGGIAQVIHDGPVISELDMGGYVKGAGLPRGAGPIIDDKASLRLFVLGLLGGLGGLLASSNAQIKRVLGPWDNGLTLLALALFIVGYSTIFFRRSVWPSLPKAFRPFILTRSGKRGKPAG